MATITVEDIRERMTKVADGFIALLGPPQEWVYSQAARFSLGLEPELGDKVAQLVLDWRSELCINSEEVSVNDSDEGFEPPRHTYNDDGVCTKCGYDGVESHHLRKLGYAVNESPCRD